MQILAALSTVEGVVAFIWLLSLPTNRQTFSISRLAGLIGILLITLFSAATLIYIRSQGKESFNGTGWITNRKFRIPLSFLLLTASLSLWVAILYKEQWSSFISESTYARLLPIVVYIVLLLLQFGVVLLLIDQPSDNDTNQFQSIGKPTLVLWGIFLAVWILASWSHLGFIHDEVGLSWGPPGTPITFVQVQFVFALIFILVFGSYLIRSGLPKLPRYLFSIKDILLFIILWGITVVIWSNQPASPTHFAPPPMPPNNETYPNSDALLFDRSSYHLLYGVGFADHLVRRPLYVGMLAFFHKIVGTDYDRTVFLQIFVLAMIPSLMYLFTSKLSNRMAGLVASGLILLREKNSIELSGVIVTSHAKLMMSDMIAMLGVILFLYATVRLLSKENPGDLDSAIVGASLGLTALIRAQVLILVPLLLLFILLSKKPLKLVLRTSVFALLGLILTMSPWIWRNWNLTGTFVLDDRGEERLLARNYSLTPYALPAQLDGETEEEFSARLKTGILTFIRTHPKEVLAFISNHLLRNLATSSVYVAPIYSTDSPMSLIDHLPYWNEWRGTLTPAGATALFFNLGLIALGIAVARAKNNWAGLFPIIAFLFYSFGNALVRSSGWRFNQPADWIILAYFSIAIAYLPSRIKLLFQQNVASQSVIERKSQVSHSTVPAMIFSALFLIGMSIPITERFVPSRGYEQFTIDAKNDLSDGKILTTDQINDFLAQENAVLISGIGLYPRFIRPNNSRVYLAEAPSGYRYLHFWLINDDDNQIVLPLQNSPSGIPHTATVSVLGCKEEGFVSAFAVIVHEPNQQMIVRDPGVSLSCPMQEPVSD